MTNQYKIQQSKKGFTLVELLVFMAVYSVLIVMITNIFVTTLDVQLQSESTTSVQDDGNFILSRLAYDIQRAESIVTPILGNTATSAQFIINGISNTYSLTSDNLTLTNDQGINQLNNFSTRLSNLSFTRLGNSTGKNIIQVSFTLRSRSTINGQIETNNFQTTIGTR